MHFVQHKSLIEIQFLEVDVGDQLIQSSKLYEDVSDETLKA